jgi:hypothetical protein
MIGRQYPRSKEPPLHDIEGCSTSNAAADTSECQVTPCVHSHLGSRVETLSGSGALARPRTRRAYSGGSTPCALNVSAIPSVQRRLSDGHARERAVKQAPGFPAIQSRDERIATRSRSDRFITTAKRMDLDPMRPSPDCESAKPF